MFAKQLAFLSLLMLLGLHSVFAQDHVEVYRLRYGDSVHVSVWKEDALQKEVKVLPDGSITFPLVGRVPVVGLSTTEVEQKIAIRLKEYIPDAVVSLVVTGIEGNRIFLLGKVLKPGSVTLTGELTVLQALSLAGGLDKFADDSSIKLIRGSGRQQEVLGIAYKDLVAGRSMTTNYVLKPGDTIVVP